MRRSTQRASVRSRRVTGSARWRVEMDHVSPAVWPLWGEVDDITKEGVSNVKRPYTAPSFLAIGRIANMTGIYKNENFLDNPSGSNAWMCPWGSC